MRWLERTYSAPPRGVPGRISMFGWLAVLAVAWLSLGVAEAHARGRGNAAMMRFYRQAAKMQQQQMAAMQKAQKEQYDAFMKRFDANGNGKIDGKEKGPANRYLRELQLGKNPDKGLSGGFNAKASSKPSSRSRK